MVKKHFRGSFLTKRQIDVLKLRQEGLTFDEIAKRLNTTRQNVYMLEKSARRNIMMAEKTLKIAKLIEAPIWLAIKRGGNLSSALGKIYKKADEHNIHIVYDGPSLEFKIKDESKGKIRGREVLGDIEIGITKEGEVIILS